jgi:hypothetical protein
MPHERRTWPGDQHTRHPQLATYYLVLTSVLTHSLAATDVGWGNGGYR